MNTDTHISKDEKGELTLAGALGLPILDSPEFELASEAFGVGQDFWDFLTGGPSELDQILSKLADIEAKLDALRAQIAALSIEIQAEKAHEDANYIESVFRTFQRNIARAKNHDRDIAKQIVLHQATLVIRDTVLRSDTRDLAFLVATGSGDAPPLLPKVNDVLFADKSKDWLSYYTAIKTEQLLYANYLLKAMTMYQFIAGIQDKGGLVVESLASLDVEDLHGYLKDMDDCLARIVPKNILDLVAAFQKLPDPTVGVSIYIKCTYTGIAPAYLNPGWMTVIHNPYIDQDPPLANPAAYPLTILSVGEEKYRNRYRLVPIDDISAPKPDRVYPFRLHVETLEIDPRCDNRHTPKDPPALTPQSHIGLEWDIYFKGSYTFMNSSFLTIVGDQKDAEQHPDFALIIHHDNNSKKPSFILGPRITFKNGMEHRYWASCSEISPPRYGRPTDPYSYPAGLVPVAESALFQASRFEFVFD
ncbi:MAG: hypothetical protein NXI16_18115 [Alphaproteobacteria bacterium]|nr:hypothetical protein [Alphaproteobacteria bacterium]